MFFGEGGFEHGFLKEYSHHPSLPFPALDVSQVGGGLRDQREMPHPKEVLCKNYNGMTDVIEKSMYP